MSFFFPTIDFFSKKCLTSQSLFKTKIQNFYDYSWYIPYSNLAELHQMLIIHVRFEQNRNFFMAHMCALMTCSICLWNRSHFQHEILILFSWRVFIRHTSIESFDGNIFFKLFSYQKLEFIFFLLQYLNCETLTYRLISRHVWYKFDTTSFWWKWYWFKFEGKNTSVICFFAFFGCF